MKKAIFLFLIVCCASNLSAQKKAAIKKAPAKSTAVPLAKADNLTAEIAKENFYLFINNKSTKDTIHIKRLEGKTVPAECMIKPFKAKNASLYLVTWKEEKTDKTDLKTEVASTLYSEVYDAHSKTKLFSNVQTTTNITEKVFLDRLKNASETKEKIRREGFEFMLTPEGDIIQKNKTQENKFAYNAEEIKYDAVKGIAQPVAKPAAKTVNKKKS